MRVPQPRIGSLMLLWLALAATTAGTARGLLPGEELTPSGLRRDTAIYVTMRDGLEIAVDVWLPANHRQGDRWPVLMKTTRYWRSNGTGWGLRALAALHIVRAEGTLIRYRSFSIRRR
jgi:predicted acyl esterase